MSSTESLKQNWNKNYYFKVLVLYELLPPSYREEKRSKKSPCDLGEHFVGSGRALFHIYSIHCTSGKILRFLCENCKIKIILKLHIYDT